VHDWQTMIKLKGVRQWRQMLEVVRCEPCIRGEKVARDCARVSIAARTRARETRERFCSLKSQSTTGSQASRAAQEVTRGITGLIACAYPRLVERSPQKALPDRCLRRLTPRASVHPAKRERQVAQDDLIGMSGATGARCLRRRCSRAAASRKACGHVAADLPLPGLRLKPGRVPRANCGAGGLLHCWQRDRLAEAADPGSLACCAIALARPR
jgi:hypothetical protein